MRTVGEMIWVIFLVILGVFLFFISTSKPPFRPPYDKHADQIKAAARREDRRRAMEAAEARGRTKEEQRQLDERDRRIKEQQQQLEHPLYWVQQPDGSWKTLGN